MSNKIALRKAVLGQFSVYKKSVFSRKSNGHQTNAGTVEFGFFKSLFASFHFLTSRGSMPEKGRKRPWQTFAMVFCKSIQRVINDDALVG